MNLQNKKVLITGALGSLGRAETEKMLSAGAQVYMLDLDEEQGRLYVNKLKCDFGESVNVKFIALNLSELELSYKTVKQLCDEIDGIDILVNNAAIMPHGPIETITLETFENAQRVNTHAVFALIKAVVPHMKAKREGRIINFCSITMNGCWGDYSPYIASKGAILALTRTLARELGKWNILVNAIAPGAIPSEAEQRVFGSEWHEYNDWVLTSQSLKHRGEPEDIGDMVVFLSSQYSKFITGQNLHVNGGWLMEG
ncbi:SDR family oxidoreductase [Buttiauxella sp. A2-C2_NF]|uniref:SDR family NAD(P)-dependent oxidoreductase n=1 Tax=Buttiauxella ferragutiae TaxID=82989 RepID=UPI001E4CB61C|nr:SDR family oxidoreductase [Buttiauxella ferragutiae]MCE0827147.1 SDR family oxidoreductase [Buttiauxella ferragutiae]